MPGSEKFLIGSVGCSDQMRGHQMWDIPIGGGAGSMDGERIHPRQKRRGRSLLNLSQRSSRQDSKVETLPGGSGEEPQL